METSGERSREKKERWRGVKLLLDDDERRTMTRSLREDGDEITARGRRREGIRLGFFFGDLREINCKGKIGDLGL